MFNDPEWASREEWDAYAWFGFAISEAQCIERQLLVVAVALSFSEGVSDPRQTTWFKLYDELGRLTLGKLLLRIRQHEVSPEDLLGKLKEAVERRNAPGRPGCHPLRTVLDDLTRVSCVMVIGNEADGGRTSI